MMSSDEDEPAELKSSIPKQATATPHIKELDEEEGHNSNSPFKSGTSVIHRQTSVHSFFNMSLVKKHMITGPLQDSVGRLEFDKDPKVSYQRSISYEPPGVGAKLRGGGVEEVEKDDLCLLMVSRVEKYDFKTFCFEGC